MPGKLCCQGQPPSFGASTSSAAKYIVKPRPLSPAAFISATRITNQQVAPEVKFTIAPCSRTLLARTFNAAGDNILTGCRTISRYEPVLTVSWPRRFPQAQLIRTSGFPYVSRSTSCPVETLRLWVRKPQVQGHSPYSGIMTRSISTKGPGMPGSRGGMAAATLVDLDDGADAAATLQKSLAAVPHHTIKNEIKLRVTELDAMGRIKITAGEYLKSDLCQQYGLHARDLRKIDGGFSNQIPVILVRPELILVNLGHIRALIKSNVIVFFDSPDSNDRVENAPFVKDLQGKLDMSRVEAGSQPFEFRALESIFLSVVASLHAEMEELVHSVTKLLAHLEDNIDQRKLKELLQYTKRVSRFESRTLLIRDVFEELLSTDEDLAAMYLTEKKEGHPRLTDSHDEVEILLEAYMKQVEEIANVLALVKHSIQSTEDFVNVILGAKRNQLLLFELRIAMGTLGISSGAIIAGFYGMNLHNYLEQEPYAFWVVSGAAVALSGVVFGTCAKKLRILAKGTT